MELKSEPVNCLLCLKSLRAHVPLKWKDDEFVEGTDNECYTKVNNQLGAIFLLRKLLDVPIDVCGVLLQSYGDPYYWISCCDSCSVLVEKGRQISCQLVLLQKQLKKVQDTLKSSIFNSGELFLNENSSKGPTGILRSYIRNEVKRASAPVENNGCNMEVDHFHLQLTSPLDLFSSQSGNNSDCTRDENILIIKSEPEILPKIENDLVNIPSNCNTEEAHVEYITGDLDFPSGTNCEPNSNSTIIYSFPKYESSKRKRGGRKRQRKHTGEKCNSCDICGKVLSRADVLKQHLRTHTPNGERPYECHICRKRFTRQIDLKKHLILHTTGKKSFKCHICGKGLSDARSFERHAHTHTWRFKCDICGEMFMRSRTLKKHAHAHTGRFKCDICGEIFLDSRTLKKHAQTHTVERLFECDTCGKEFKTSQALNQHKKWHLPMYIPSPAPAHTDSLYIL